MEQALCFGFGKQVLQASALNLKHKHTIFLVSIHVDRNVRLVHQFFLQFSTTGSIISCHPGPEPKSGRKDVSAIVTMRGGNKRISLARMNAGRLKRDFFPFVTFHVTYVVSIPLMKKNVSTDSVPLKNH